MADGLINREIMPEPARRHVVVLLTADECERYPGKTCVMSVLGPYTREEADTVFAQQPEWAAPHRMIMNEENR
jgi:hypothetical protein